MPELLVERDRSMIVITINRPESRNAINLPVAEGIAAALDELDRDPELRVGIITGAGGYFSAGMDLKAFASTGQRPHLPGRGFAGIVEGPPDKPIIAAIEGFAVAGGLEIALACDLIVAAEGAKLGVPEVKRGLMAAAGALLRLPASLPRQVLMEMVLTGDTIDAERAAEYGLVNTLTKPEEALVVATSLARRIAENAPLALVNSKAVIRESSGWRPDEAFDRQRPFVDEVMGSADAREGALAFIEKRAPCWTGR